MNNIYISPPSDSTRQHLELLRGLLYTYGISDTADTIAICYGSTIRNNSLTSDLDMLIIESKPQNEAKKYDFIQSLKDLHLSTSRAIDIEVPYENKLFYDTDEVAASLGLSMFMDGDMRLRIRTLEAMADDDPYFASPEMKLRLCLNALTSQHVLLCGNEHMYEQIRDKAAVSLERLGRLVASKASEQTMTYDTVRNLLVQHGDIGYKDYLGYAPDDAYFDAILQKAFSRAD